MERHSNIFVYADSSVVKMTAGWKDGEREWSQTISYRPEFCSAELIQHYWDKTHEDGWIEKIKNGAT